MLKFNIGRLVGTGTDIDILYEPWLPCVNDSYVLTNHEALNDNKVESLTVIGQSRWDIGLIRDILDNMNVNLSMINIQFF